MPFLMKQTARLLCPPALWNVLRRYRRFIAPGLNWLFGPHTRTVSTLEGLDAEIARAVPLGRVGHDSDALTAQLDSFSFALPRDLPADPHSREYHDYQMAFYTLLSGCNEYRAEECEHAPVDDDKR